MDGCPVTVAEPAARIHPCGDVRAVVGAGALWCAHMRDIVIYGLGELGRLFAGGAARAGMRVTPIVRGATPQAALGTVAPGSAIVVAVGEADLAAAVSAIPAARLGDVVLIQNELFPAVWRDLGLATPTVMVPWILKKKGLPVRIVQPTPVHGPHAQVVAAVHAGLELPATILPNEDALADALVAKYTFILVVNALGALENRAMGTWLADAPHAVRALAADAVALGAARLGTERAPALEDIVLEVERGMTVLADIPAAGRTARARVDGALAWGRKLGVALPALEAVARGQRPT